MNKKKIMIISIILVITLTTTLLLTRPNLRKLLGSVNLMNLQAIDVPYTNNSQSTVQGAIDDLYTKASNMECAEGYTKGETTSNGGYICFLPSEPICKRATTLHTETCEQTDTSSYCSATGDVGNGNTITYGILGTGNSLTPGEALDCKVTSTGDYTERFYYITDLESNSDYAVLIYYKDTSIGGVSYNATNENFNGPRSGINSLPTTSIWDNISLAEPVRQIYSWDSDYPDVYNTTTTGNGSYTLSTFDYTGYAGRLLTMKEVREACTTAFGKGTLTNCSYLLENTKYSNSSNTTLGPWLETPFSGNYSWYVWNLVGNNRCLDYNGASMTNYYGIRPAIEVLKSKIQLD